MNTAGRGSSRPGSRGASNSGLGLGQWNGPGVGPSAFSNLDVSNHTYTSRQSGITEASSYEAQLARQFSTYDVDGQVENPEGLQLRLREASAMADAINNSIRSVRSSRSLRSIRNDASNHYRVPSPAPTPLPTTSSPSALSGLVNHGAAAAANGSAHGGNLAGIAIAGAAAAAYGPAGLGGNHASIPSQGVAEKDGSVRGGVQGRGYSSASGNSPNLLHTALDEQSAYGGGSPSVFIDVQPSLSPQLSAVMASAAAAHARQQRLTGQQPALTPSEPLTPAELLQLYALQQRYKQHHELEHEQSLSLYSPHHHGLQHQRDFKAEEVRHGQSQSQSQSQVGVSQQQWVVPQQQNMITTPQQQQLDVKAQPPVQPHCLCCIPCFLCCGHRAAAAAAAAKGAVSNGPTLPLVGGISNGSKDDPVAKLHPHKLPRWQQLTSLLFSSPCRDCACTGTDAAAWFVTYCSKFGGNLDTRMPPESCATLISSWLGAFLGILAVSALNRFVTPQVDLTLMIASFGATAVLIYGVPTSKMASPRNVMGGHLVSALVGIIVRLIFKDLPWVSAPFGMATALLCMQLLSVTHPPGGATALIAATAPTIGAAHGFTLLLTVLFGILAMLSIAALHNNLWPTRRYPTFWY